MVDATAWAPSSYRPEDWAWHDDAACDQTDVPRDDRLAFTLEASSKQEGEARARELGSRYCAHCPVVRQCVNWAERDTSFSGIAAGTVYNPSVRKARKAEQQARRSEVGKVLNG